MIRILLFFAFLLLMLLAIRALYWAVQKQAFPIGKRHLHLRFILGVVLLELLVFNYYLTAPLLELLDRIITHPTVQQVLSVLLPSRSYELSYLLLTVLGLNLLLLLGTLVLCWTIRRLFGTKNLYFLPDEDYYGRKKLFFPVHKLVCRFFEPVDAERSALTPAGHCMGKWAGGMKWGFGLLGMLQLLLLALSILWGSDEWNATVKTVSKACYWLPLGGFLLADQIQAFFLDKPAFDTACVELDKKTVQLRGNLDQQEENYRRTFAGALLCCRELQVSEQDKGDLTTDPGNQLISDCDNPRILSVLCDQLKHCGQTDQPEHYQRALASLLDGKHINVCDQPEGEFFIYLTAYLNFLLSQGQTAVILCRNSRDAQRTKQTCQNAMHRLNSISTVWQVCNAREAVQDTPMNLLICSYDELLTLRLLEIRREFAGALNCVVIAHPEQLLAQDSIRIRRLFNELRLYSGDLQYVLLSETDNSHLRSVMEATIGSGTLLPFNHTFCREDTCMMVWKEESCHKLQRQLRIGTATSPYLGTALPLALAAARWDIPKTFIIPADDRPEDAYWNHLYSDTMNVAEYLSNGADISNVIRLDRAEALEPYPMKQLICYDTRYDLISTARAWTKYAGSRDAIVHMICPHYLLREYFAHRFDQDTLTLQDKPVEALLPQGCVLDRSNMALLLVDLWDRGMTEEALLQKSRQYGWSFQSAEEVLQACLTTLLPEEPGINLFEHFSFRQCQRQLEQDGSLVTETFVTMVNAQAYDRVMALTRRARVQVGPDCSFELPIPAEDLTNYYLRDQQLALHGQSYKVDLIRDGVLFATQHNDNWNAYDYFPVSRFGFEDYQLLDHCLDSAFLDLNIATAKTTRQILGYWKSNCGYRIGSDGIFTFESLADSPVNECKQVAILELNLKQSQMGSTPEHVTLALAFILKDLFKTFFPDTHQNLFAVICGQEGGTPRSTEEILSSMVPRVSNAPNKSGVQTVYVVEYSTPEYGMIKLLYRNWHRIIQTVQDYLSWYLSPGTAGANTLLGTELHFGGQTLPANLPLPDLLRLLKAITGQDSAEADSSDAPADTDPVLSHTCAFCGRRALIMPQVEDGRLMCNNCFDHQVTDRNEIRTMLARILRTMEKEYGILLRKDLKIRFLSADELRPQTEGLTDNRLLGVCQPEAGLLLLESGGPRVPMKGTLIHELVRCWQWDNLPLSRLSKALDAKDGDRQLNLLLEGHAFFVEVMTMNLMHEKAYARHLDRLLLQRTDGYGKSYRLLKDFYEQRIQDRTVNGLTVMKQLSEDVMEKRVMIE